MMPPYEVTATDEAGQAQRHSEQGPPGDAQEAGPLLLSLSRHPHLRRYVLTPTHARCLEVLGTEKECLPQDTHSMGEGWDRGDRHSRGAQWCQALLSSPPRLPSPALARTVAVHSLVPGLPFVLHHTVWLGRGPLGPERPPKAGMAVGNAPARRPWGCGPEQPGPVSLTSALWWSQVTSPHHPSVCLLSQWWALAGCSGMAMAACSPPSASPLNSEQTISSLSVAGLTTPTQGEHLNEWGLVDIRPITSPPHTRSSQVARYHGSSLPRVLGCAENPLPLHTLPRLLLHKPPSALRLGQVHLPTRSNSTQPSSLATCITCSLDTGMSMVSTP